MWMKATIAMSAVSVLLLLFPGCGLQRHLLYYPGKASIADIQQYTTDNGLQMWPLQNAAYQGIVSGERLVGSKGTVVVFHGNGGPAVARKHYISALETRGYRVVLAEYPGYGGRPGELSERSFVADARDTVLRAVEEFGAPLYLWGESMGCGVASALADDPELRPKGVAMITAWDSLPNTASAKFAWLPVGLFIRDRYDNVVNLTHYQGPVAVIMAGRDKVIPNRLTNRLYDSLSQPKRLWIFETAGHNDWPHSPELAWWDEVMDFLTNAKP